MEREVYAQHEVGNMERFQIGVYPKPPKTIEEMEVNEVQWALWVWTYDKWLEVTDIEFMPGEIKKLKIQIKEIK